MFLNFQCCLFSKEQWPQLSPAVAAAVHSLQPFSTVSPFPTLTTAIRDSFWHSQRWPLPPAVTVPCCTHWEFLEKPGKSEVHLSLSCRRSLCPFWGWWNLGERREMEMSALAYVLQGTYFNEQSNSHLNQDVNLLSCVSGTFYSQ